MKKLTGVFFASLCMVTISTSSFSIFASDFTGEKAKEIAEKKVPNGSVHISTKDDGKKYEIEFYQESNKEWYELDVNKASQTVVSFDTKKTNHQGGSTVTLTEAQVKEIVLKEQKTADILSVKLEKDDGLMEYEVKFKADNCYGKYTIHPSTGVILERDLTIGSLSSRENFTNLISYEKAKSIALEQYPDGRVTDIDLEWEDSAYCYQIEVIQNGLEYEMELDAQTGSVLWYGAEDGEKTKKQNTSKSNSITMEQAKQIVLEKAPGAYVKEIKLDHDDGMTLYEGELLKGDYEYEFEVDAATGKIVKWEVERDD